MEILLFKQKVISTTSHSVYNLLPIKLTCATNILILIQHPYIVPFRRRIAADFPGAHIILRQLKEKPAHRRVGFVSQGPPARGHTEILHPETKGSEAVGQVTSGCPSPSIGGGTNIAMGYIPMALSKPGTKVQLMIRKKPVEAVVAKMPFVPTKYFS